MEESLKKRIQANKELHEKMAILNARLKEKSKECNEERTKLLSLENQNEYLIKKLDKNDGKENIHEQRVDHCNKDRENQLQ